MEDRQLYSYLEYLRSVRDEYGVLNMEKYSEMIIAW